MPLCTRLSRQRGNRLSGEGDLASIRSHNTTDGVHQCGFTGAVRADHADQFTLIDMIDTPRSAATAP